MLGPAHNADNAYVSHTGTSFAAPYVAGFASRDEILERSDVVVLPKPQHEDVAKIAWWNWRRVLGASWSS